MAGEQGRHAKLFASADFGQTCKIRDHLSIARKRKMVNARMREQKRSVARKDESLGAKMSSWTKNVVRYLRAFVMFASSFYNLSMRPNARKIEIAKNAARNCVRNPTSAVGSPRIASTPGAAVDALSHKI